MGASVGIARPRHQRRDRGRVRGHREATPSAERPGDAPIRTRPCHPSRPQAAHRKWACTCHQRVTDKQSPINYAQSRPPARRGRMLRSWLERAGCDSREPNAILLASVPFPQLRCRRLRIQLLRHSHVCCSQCRCQQQHPSSTPHLTRRTTPAATCMCARKTASSAQLPKPC